MGPLGVAQIFVFVGFLELFVMKQKEGSFPGDMSRVNPFEKQWENFDEETKLRKRAIELNNGRAAQMGIFAMMIHEELANQPYILNDSKWRLCWWRLNELRGFIVFLGTPCPSSHVQVRRVQSMSTFCRPDDLR